MATLNCTGIGVLTRTTPFGILTIPYYQMDGAFVSGNNNFYSVPRNTKLFLQGASVLVDSDQKSPFTETTIYFQGQYAIYGVYRNGVDIIMQYIKSDHTIQNIRIARGAAGYCGAFKTLYRDVNGYFALTDQQSLLTGPLDSYTQYAAPTISTLGYYASESPLGSPLAGWVNLDLDIVTHLTDFINVFYVVPPTEDPYGQGGTTTPSPKPPTGTYDPSSDPIDFPTPPALGALASKFITVYNPSPADLASFASYLWTGAFDPANFKKLLADPFQALIGLSIIPIQPQKESTPHTLSFGNISTGISMYRCTNHYEIFDCGSITLEEYWGSYLDYDPYTKISIFLPYIGTEHLSADDVMGKTIAVKYMIDIISGACVASIKCDNSVLYQFSGNCCASIPITGNDWNAVISGSIQSLISTAGVIAAGVAGSPVAAGAAVGLMASSAQNAMEMKTNVKRSGNISGCSGFLGNQTPYLIITRPRQAVPMDQNKYSGYPSYITENLADLSGFTIVDHIHLTGVHGTDAEIEEILALLKEGVIL